MCVCVCVCVCLIWKHLLYYRHCPTHTHRKRERKTTKFHMWFILFSEGFPHFNVSLSPCLHVSLSYSLLQSPFMSSSSISSCHLIHFITGKVVENFHFFLTRGVEVFPTPNASNAVEIRYISKFKLCHLRLLGEEIKWLTKGINRMWRKPFLWCLCCVLTCYPVG